MLMRLIGEFRSLAGRFRHSTLVGRCFFFFSLSFGFAMLCSIILMLSFLSSGSGDAALDEEFVST